MNGAGFLEFERCFRRNRQARATRQHIDRGRFLQRPLNLGPSDRQGLVQRGGQCSNRAAQGGIISHLGNQGGRPRQDSLASEQIGALQEGPDEPPGPQNDAEGGQRAAHEGGQDASEVAHGSWLL